MHQDWHERLQLAWLLLPPRLKKKRLEDFTQTDFDDLLKAYESLIFRPLPGGALQVTFLAGFRACFSVNE